MDEEQAAVIISALANGVDPRTGEIFPADSAYQSAQVVRALYVAVRALEARPRRARPRAGLPANAGKPWSEVEDRKLLAEFDLGRPVAELAAAHERTHAGIHARLERHGRVPAGFAARRVAGGAHGGPVREEGKLPGEESREAPAA